MDLSNLKNIDVNDLFNKLKSGGLADKKLLIKFGIGFSAVLIFLIIYYIFVSPKIAAQEEKIKIMNENREKIIEFNNKKITSFKDLPKVVAETPIDSEVIVKVWRNGEIIDIKVKVGELDEGRKLAKNDGVYLEELDITVLELTIDAINSLGLDSKTKGILVTEVGDKNENLLKNDVIIQVSSEKITDISSFEKIISNSINLNRDKLLLRVIRDGNEFWLINPFVIE